MTPSPMENGPETTGPQTAPTAAFAPPPTPSDARAERLRKAMPLIAGGAVAALLAITLAAFALHGAGPADGDAAARDVNGMQIEVAATQPPPPMPVSPGKLEVLSADQIAAAPTPPPAAPGMDPYNTAPNAAYDPSAYAPTAEPVRADRCAGAATLAQDMVCQDAQLAAADRQLNRVYRAALRSGAVNPDDLRADQRDWLAIREDAAHRSIRAVDAVYRQRIAELEEIVGGN